MKKFITLGVVLLPTGIFGQTVINHKGSRVSIDSSKWKRVGSVIYNKDKVNVGIGTTTPLSALSLGGYLKLGTGDSYADTMATAANRAGMIRYRLPARTIQYHDGTQWNTMASTDRVDTTNDGWRQQVTDSLVRLAYQSDGSSTRIPGAEFVIRDNGNTGIGVTTPSSKLTVNGSFAAAYNNVTANTYAAGENDFYVSWSGTAAGTITLPASASSNRTGRLYYFKNESPLYTLTIDAAGSELIGGRQTFLLYPGESVLLIKTNTQLAAGTTYGIVNHTHAEAKYLLYVSSHASQTRLQNVTATSDFSTVAYGNDYATDFNFATDAWTCPKTGVYRLDYTEVGYQTVVNVGTHVMIYLSKNTSTMLEEGGYTMINPSNVSSLRSSAHISTVAELQQGDEITVSALLCSGCGAPQMICVSRQLIVERL